MQKRVVAIVTSNDAAMEVVRAILPFTTAVRIEDHVAPSDGGTVLTPAKTKGGRVARPVETATVLDQKRQYRETFRMVALRYLQQNGTRTTSEIRAHLAPYFKNSPYKANGKQPSAIRNAMERLKERGFVTCENSARELNSSVAGRPMYELQWTITEAGRKFLWGLDQPHQSATVAALR